MANQLGMAEQQAIIALAGHGWSKRRIARELGVHRETVDRYLRRNQGPPESGDGADSKPAISTTGPEKRNEFTGSPWISGDGALGIEPDDSKPAISTAGSAGRRSECEPFREQIIAGVERGLSAQRIWQDLTGEQGCSVSYESVKRFVRRLRAIRPVPFRRMECAPGEEAQIDFGVGASIVTPDDRPGPAGARLDAARPTSSASC